MNVVCSTVIFITIGQIWSYYYTVMLTTDLTINADSFSKEICIIAISLEELSASVKLCLLLLNLCTISYFYRYLS